MSNIVCQKDKKKIATRFSFKILKILLRNLKTYLCSVFHGDNHLEKNNVNSIYNVNMWLCSFIGVLHCVLAYVLLHGL